MDTKEERKKEMLKEKLNWIIILVILWFCLFFFEYSFNHLFYNGLIVFASTILFYSVIANDKFYIHTGYKENEKEHVETFRVFCLQYPGYAIYVKLLSFIVISLLVISIGMMIGWVVKLF